MRLNYNFSDSIYMHSRTEVIREPSATAGSRDGSSDAFKGVLILLVVWFHSNFSGSSAQAALAWVNEVSYTFLMPAFCLVSGYYCGVRVLTRTRAERLVLPYVIMTAIYIVGINVAARFGLGTANQAPALSIQAFLESIFSKPVGPYWYLHALILYVITLDLTKRIQLRLGAGFAIAFGFVGVCCMMTAGVRLYAIIFFFAGTLLRFVYKPNGQSIHGLIGLVAMLAMFILFGWQAIADRGSLASIGWTLGACLVFYTVLKWGEGGRIVSGLGYIGRQTLPVFLFHPIAMQLTNLVGKKTAQVVAFAPVILLLSLAINVILCLCMAKVVRLMPGGYRLLGPGETSKHSTVVT